MTTTAASALEHEVIMASAGSGKTFQLTNRYLRLLLEGAPPESMLASTFTRAAAAEIRDRVLDRLACAVDEDDSRAQLAAFIGPAALDRSHLLERLTLLSRNLHRLQIRTLDSFFGGIVRAFAFELGIDPAAEIIDESTDRALRREAIRLMLDERDPQPLIDLLRVFTDGATDRSVTDAIDTVVRDLYDLYREAPPEAWDAVESIGGRMTIEDYQHALEQLHALEESAAELQNVEKHFFNHKSIQRVFVNDCAWLRSAARLGAGDWLRFLGSGISAKIIQGETLYQRRTIPEDVREVYRIFIDHGRAVVRDSIVHRTKSTRDLIDRFHHQYEALKHRHKAMTFADITNLMQQAARRDMLPEICFRLDATLHHLLLDEMQDTSITQWRSLEPFAHETVSYRPPQRTYFCVGDVKQSIYGWRGACPEILEHMPDLLTGPGGESAIRTRPIDVNFRSSPVVIDLVNSVYEGIEHNPALTETPEAAAQWAAVFKEHTPHHTDRPGYIELRAAPEADEGEAQPRARLGRAADLIRDLHEQMPQRRIGVLSRKGATVNTLLYELTREHRGVPATGFGGGALTDAAAVNAILDLLRMVDHPDHTIAAFNVAHSPLGAVAGLEPGTTPVPPVAVRRRVAARIRRRLLDRGYAAVIREWIESVAAQTDSRQFTRLLQLQHMAARFDERPSLRCDDFIAMVEQSTVSDAGASPVQVMTIHQSKGLQFDIVVLPELDEKLSVLRNLQVVVKRDSPTGGIARIVRHIGAEAWDLFDDLRPMLDAHRVRQARESLALLYVALTRAKFALHMIIDPPRESEKTLPKTMAGLLRHALTGNEPIEPDAVLHHAGDPAWHEQVPLKDDDDEPVRPETRVMIKPARARGMVPRGRQGRAASAEHEAEAPLRDRLILPSTDARNRGTAIHALFEQVTWLEDGLPDEDSLRAIVRRAAPRQDDGWIDEQIRAFHEMLKAEPIRASLARGESESDQVSLWREWPYARLHEGAVEQGYIDRLVVRRNAGRVDHAEVIDFKTDAIELAEVEERAAGYRPQIDRYRRAVSESFGLDPAQVDGVLLFVTAGWAARLPAD